MLREVPGPMVPMFLQFWALKSPEVWVKNHVPTQFKKPIHHLSSFNSMNSVYSCILCIIVCLFLLFSTFLSTFSDPFCGPCAPLDPPFWIRWGRLGEGLGGAVDQAGAHHEGHAPGEQCASLGADEGGTGEDSYGFFLCFFSMVSMVSNSQKPWINMDELWWINYGSTVSKC